MVSLVNFLHPEIDRASSCRFCAWRQPRPSLPWLSGTKTPTASITAFRSSSAAGWFMNALTPAYWLWTKYMRSSLTRWRPEGSDLNSMPSRQTSFFQCQFKSGSKISILSRSRKLTILSSSLPGYSVTMTVSIALIIFFNKFMSSNTYPARMSK